MTISPPMFENQMNTIEDLAHALSTSAQDVAVIFEKVEEDRKPEQLEMLCSDFLQCFDIEGELISGGKASVHLRKEIPPRIQVQLLQLLCNISSAENAKEQLLESGVAPGEMLETTLLAFIGNPIYSIPFLTKLQKLFASVESQMIIKLR